MSGSTAPEILMKSLHKLERQLLHRGGGEPIDAPFPEGRYNEYGSEFLKRAAAAGRIKRWPSAEGLVDVFINILDGLTEDDETDGWIIHERDDLHTAQKVNENDDK